MTLALYTGSDSLEGAVVVEPRSKDGQKQRILAALGHEGRTLPLVDEETLFRYYEYLSENLAMPLRACYLEPTNGFPASPPECTVLELLDPSKYPGDPFDGILCRVRKAGFEVNLPLLELETGESSASFQMIEDYWYWFWNWRCV